MANGELTPEAIEEFIAAQQALLPRMEPPVAPPSMQFVTGRIPSAVMAPPPVPLPMRAPQRFTAMSAPPVIDPLEAVRKRINEIDFKTKQDAVEAATQFEAMRQYQQDLAAGKDPSRWLPLLFKKNPSVIPGVMRERRLSLPPAAPAMHSLTNPATGDAVPFATYAGRGQFVPRSALPQPPLSTNVTEYAIPGTTNIFARSIPSGPQTRRFFEADTGRLSPSANISRLNALIRATEKELTSLPTVLAGVPLDESIKDKTEREAERKKRFDSIQGERQALKDEVDGWRQQLKEMNSTGQTVSAPKATEKKLTPDLARDFLKRAGGDKEKARQLAKDAGYEF